MRQLIDDLEARREPWGISYFVIFEPYIETFAPVVANFAGKREFWQRVTIWGRRSLSPTDKDLILLP